MRIRLWTVARAASWGLAVWVGALAQPTMGRDHVLPLFLSASNVNQPSASGVHQEGFVRIINHSNEEARVNISGCDDAGWCGLHATLTLGAKRTVHLNSRDIEEGNADKGFPEGLGAPTEGDWVLLLESRQDIEPLAYIRTRPDGFLTSMSAVAPSGAMRYRVSIFNPASNFNQRSWLRLVNPGSEDANVTISGIDDAGVPAPGGVVELTLASREARSVTSQALESGASDLTGSFGEKEVGGKWQLTVASDQPLMVMSLLDTPTGHLSNLSAPKADYRGPAGVWEVAFDDGVTGGYLIATTDSRLYGWWPLADGTVRVADGGYFASGSDYLSGSGEVYESGEVEIRGAGIGGDSAVFGISADYRQGDWIKGGYHVEGAETREFYGWAFTGFDRGANAAGLAGAWTTTDSDLSFSVNADAEFSGSLQVDSFECDLTGALEGIHPAFNLYESAVEVDCGLLQLDVEMILAIGDKPTAPGGNDHALALVIARDDEVAVGATATR